MTNPGKCRSCGADIIWLLNDRTDKRAPIDAEPTAKGNLLIDHALGIYLVLAALERTKYPGQLHTNHFMTCRDARQWAGKDGK